MSDLHLSHRQANRLHRQNIRPPPPHYSHIWDSYLGKYIVLQARSATARDLQEENQHWSQHETVACPLPLTPSRHRHVEQDAISPKNDVAAHEEDAVERRTGSQKAEHCCSL